MRLTTSLPESVRAPLDLHLWSEVEGRVPKGAYQAFIVERIQEFFTRRPDTKLAKANEALKYVVEVHYPVGFTDWPPEYKAAIEAALQM